MLYNPHDYQRYAQQHIIDHDKCGLFLDMGLGKTSITLSAINELMYDSFDIKKVLVIAPIRVADITWEDEINKWDHLKYLRISKILGTSKNRIDAICKEADIYTINRENVQWLVEYCGKHWPFDMVVIDELSSFKNPKAKRFKALKRVIPCVKRFVGLTGTPAPRSLADLWPQIYLMDRGVRLGPTLTEFRCRYLKPGKSNGHVVYEWLLQEGAKRRMYEAIEDICMSLKSEDWLKLPDRRDVNIEINMTEAMHKSYREFEREKILSLNEDGVIVGSNAGVVMGKLLQYASGMIYNEEHIPVEIHDLKLQALDELVEASNGKPLLIFYYYKFDFDRIKNRYSNLVVRSIESNKDVEDWNAGLIDILLVHPASTGHGLNLQEGGNTVVWYTLPNWNLELYQQANARLHRQGQKNSVTVYHLITKKTVDEDVLKSLEQKDVSQQSLMKALKARIED